MEERIMDNNFNIQNNNMGQPMYQQMPQQPVMQYSNNSKPKSKKGLIIGLIIGIVLLLTATTITLLAIFVWGAEAELEGKWKAEDGTVVEFEKLIENDNDQDGYIYYSISVDGEMVVVSCPRADNMIEIKYMYKEWSDEEGAYIYDTNVHKLKIVKLTNSKLVIKYDGKEYKFKRK